MFSAVRSATLAVCTAVAVLAPASTAHATGPDFTTWLFAEGSTSGLLGFEKEILIANPNTTPVTVTMSIFTDDGTPVAPFVISAAPLSRTGVNVRSIPGVGDRAGLALRLTATGPIIAERTMYWGGGLFRGGKAWTAPVSDMRGGHNEKGVPEGARTWYFAEGEGRFFNSFISVANPNTTPATVTATYRNDVGTEATETLVVPANGRQTFWPSAELTRSDRSTFIPAGRSGFAATVTSDLDVVAERQMYWGPGAPFGIRGGHAAMGVTTPSADWYFAEGVQGGAGGFDTYVLLYNHLTTPTNVTVTFLGDAGVTLATHTHTLPGGTRYNVPAPVIPELANQEFAIQVTGSQPLVAERAVYWRGFTEGHATAGATAPARKWGFAEGLQGGFQMYQDNGDNDKRRFNTFFPIFNPQNTGANITVHFLLENGETGNVGVTKTIFVPARSRGTLWTLEHDELANKKFATFFESDQAVVIERVVYWGRNNRAGHASVGTPLPDGFVIGGAPNAPSTPGTTLTVTPNRGVPSGGTLVEIEGSGFGHSEKNTQVLFGGTALRGDQFEVENDTLIRAVSPPGATGKVDVTVITKGQTITAPQAFEYFDKNAAWAPVSFGDQYSLVEQVAAQRPFDLLFSCTEHGSPNSNTFMFEVVVALRKRFQTNRWGLNWKRGNVGDLSQDIVNYYSGPEGASMRNSTDVRIYDIIGGHCGNRPGPFWVDQTGPTRAAGTVGRFTVDPMCSNPRYRDAKFDNGEWMFPECR